MISCKCLILRRYLCFCKALLESGWRTAVTGFRFLFAKFPRGMPRKPKVIE